MLSAKDYLLNTPAQCTVGTGDTTKILCVNGGTAAGTTGECTCSCKSGFSGTLCETKGSII